LLEQGKHTLRPLFFAKLPGESYGGH